MIKHLPTLAAAAVILAACSAGGTDTMAELMHDAGAMLEDAGRMMMGAAATIDAAGPADARAAAELDAKKDEDARAEESARDGASATRDGSGQPVPPRALEADCSLTRTVTTTQKNFGLDTPTVTVTTHYFAEFVVADATTVRLALTCEPVLDPVAIECPANNEALGATYSCTGFMPKGDCVSSGFYASGGKIHVPCGTLSTNQGFPGKDNHYRKAKLVVES